MSDESNEQKRNPSVDEQIQAMLGKAEESENAEDEELQPAESESPAEGEEGELEGDEGEEGDEEGDDEPDEDEVEEEDEDAEEEEEGAEEEEEEEEEESGEEPDDSATELSRLKRENEALKRTLDQSPDMPPPREEPVDDQPEVLDVPTVDLVDDEAYDKALESREALNELLNKVRKNAIEFTYEAVLKRIPQVVQRQVSHESAQQKMVDDFFRANEDLLPVRRYVALEFQTLMASNPDMSYPDLLEQTAKIVRKSLGMTQTVGRKGKPRKSLRRAPSGPDGSRSRQQPRKPSGIAAEIAAMARAGR
jgi:hypothetical protein